VLTAVGGYYLLKAATPAEPDQIHMVTRFQMTPRMLRALGSGKNGLVY
jgi:hypothetical protein